MACIILLLTSCLIIDDTLFYYIIKDLLIPVFSTKWSANLGKSFWISFITFLSLVKTEIIVAMFERYWFKVKFYINIQSRLFFIGTKNFKVNNLQSSYNYMYKYVIYASILTEHNWGYISQNRKKLTDEQSHPKI